MKNSIQQKRQQKVKSNSSSSISSSSSNNNTTATIDISSSSRNTYSLSCNSLVIASLLYRPILYPKPSVVVLCFSSVSLDSFVEAETVLWPEISERYPMAPVILVATKCDLKERAVGADLGEAAGSTRRENYYISVSNSFPYFFFSVCRSLYGGTYSSPSSPVPTLIPEDNEASAASSSQPPLPSSASGASTTSTASTASSTTSAAASPTSSGGPDSSGGVLLMSRGGGGGFGRHHQHLGGLRGDMSIIKGFNRSISTDISTLGSQLSRRTVS